MTEPSQHQPPGEVPPSEVPPVRIDTHDTAEPNRQGKYVLYWMTAQRRLRYNFALQRAVDWARHLDRPLLLVEVLGCGGRWQNDRRHRFVLDGMREHAEQLRAGPATYYPLVERSAGEALAMLDALAPQAAVVVADDYPLTGPADPAAGSLGVRCELVDSNGLLPLRAAEKDYPTAHAFRRLLQRALPEHLECLPKSSPLSRVKLPKPRALPPEIRNTWPAAGADLLRGEPDALAALPIDHQVPPVEAAGGPAAAEATLRRFMRRRLADYDTQRNHPDADVASGLSPYLHFGHISAHEVFHAIVRAEKWSPERISPGARGSREGYWGMSAPAEAFLDELITWRELGYNFCTHRDDVESFESLPPWAQQTLQEHAGDARPYVYRFEELESAATDDPLWNAAQRQLLREGIIHNYLRMLWGKKILQWSETPREALATMIELNNKYAIDGCDPNSYSGIGWVLGRFDRAWGPEREVFGKIRYMTSESAARKLRLGEYQQRFAQ